MTDGHLRSTSTGRPPDTDRLAVRWTIGNLPDRGFELLRLSICCAFRLFEFWPRSPELGTCGAHLVSMNAAHLAWNYYDKPADSWLNHHWLRHRPELYRMAGLELPD